MTYRFTLTADKAWCANCGTVSTDGECDCSRGYAPCKPDWKPYDGRAFEEINKLRAENKSLREALVTLDQFASAGADYHGSILRERVHEALGDAG